MIIFIYIMIIITFSFIIITTTTTNNNNNNNNNNNMSNNTTKNNDNASAKSASLVFSPLLKLERGLRVLLYNSNVCIYIYIYNSIWCNST